MQEKEITSIKVEEVPIDFWMLLENMEKNKMVVLES